MTSTDGTGAVAGRDVELSGTYAAGRDVVVHQHAAPAAPTVRPSEIPARVAGFVDRRDVVDELCGIVEASLATDRLLIATVCGPPGVGKTALALEIAHLVADKIGSGSLYVDLSGGQGAPLQPVAVLGELLLALGAGRVPDELVDRGRVFRSTLATGRYLLLLDNAFDERQLRPLLPGGGAAVVLVTSRRRIVLPEINRSVALEALDERSGLELLASVAGADRVGDQAADGLRIVRSCGGFPLALHIAAARLARRPHWRLDRLAGLLADERRRLGELDMGDAEVRAGFLTTYEAMDDEPRRLLRLLGLVDTPDFAPWLPAVLLGANPSDPEALAHAEDVAADLCEAHLLQVAGAGSDDNAASVGAGPRYVLHDLLRSFAHERLEEESDEVERDTVLDRVLAAYFDLAVVADAGFSAANTAVWDGPDGRPAVAEEHTTAASAAPMEWFAVERSNLLHLIDRAHRSGRWQAAWRLASAMWQFLEVTARWSDWATAYGLAVDAARQAEDRVAESSCLRLLGRLALARGDTDEAGERFDAALAVLAAADGIADLHGESMLRKDMAVGERLRNRHVRSCELLLTALDGFRRLGETYWEAIIRRELGIEYRYLGQWPEAASHLRPAVTVFSDMGEHLQEAQTLFELAVLLRLQGEWDEADRCLARSGPTIERLDARGLRAWALREAALVASGRGDVGTASERLVAALASWEEVGDRVQWAITLHERAILHERGGEDDRAIADCRQALDLLGEDGALYRARVLVTLARLSLDAGRPDDAVAAAREALPLVRDNEDLPWEVAAQQTLARAHAARGEAKAEGNATVIAEALSHYAATGAGAGTRF